MLDREGVLPSSYTRSGEVVRKGADGLMAQLKRNGEERPQLRAVEEPGMALQVDAEGILSLLGGNFVYQLTFAYRREHYEANKFKLPIHKREFDEEVQQARTLDAATEIARMLNRDPYYSGAALEIIERQRQAEADAQEPASVFEGSVFYPAAGE